MDTKDMTFCQFDGGGMDVDGWQEDPEPAWHAVRDQS